MIYIIDTANLEKIRECMEYYPIDGVTTNPTIISKENTGFLPLIKSIRELIGPDKQLHIQATESTAEGMVKEAVALQEAVGGNFYVKIPVTREGLKATAILHKMGIKVTETAIFTQQQALMAATAGADFVAPYVNRLDNIVCDGCYVVEEIVTLFKEHDLKTQVLAASFKNPEQVHKVALCGGHAVTVAPEIFPALINHPLTDKAVSDFMNDWSGVYGDKTVLDLLGKRD